MKHVKGDDKISLKNYMKKHLTYVKNCIEPEPIEKREVCKKQIKDQTQQATSNR